MTALGGALALNALVAVDRPRSVPWGALPAPRRLLAWAALSVLVAATLHRASVEAILQVALNPKAVMDQRLVHGWGALALCLGGLWLKRAAIRAALDLNPTRIAPGSTSVRPEPEFSRARGEGPAPSVNLWTLALGIGWLIASTALFPPAALLACVLGLFALLVGRAAFWPSVLMGIYLGSVGFPAAIERWADAPVGMVTATMAGGALLAIDFPLALSGQFITFQDSAGNVIRVLINSACAGPATLGVFLAIYALMAIDAPLPWRAALGTFAFGFICTWLQNVGRLVYLLLVGHHQGEPAMWVAHDDSGYVWFIAWYAVFGLVYLKVAAGRR